MFTVVITEKGGAQRRLQFDKPEITIGRVQGNDIILPKGNVSKRHSRIVLKDARFIVVDLKSTNGTYVNGRKITSPLVVKGGDKIYIGDFILTLEEDGASAGVDGQSDMPSAPPPPAPEPMRAPPPAAAPSPPAAPSARAATGSQAAIERPQPPPPGQRSSGAIPLPPTPGGTGSAAVPPRPLRPTGEVMGPPPVPSAKPAVRDDSAQTGAPPQADRFALDQEPDDESAPPAPKIVSASSPRVESPPSPHTGSRSAPAIATPAPPRVVASRPPVSDPEVDTGFRGLMKRLGSSFDTRNAEATSMQDSTRWQQAQAAIDGAIGAMTREGQLAAVIDRTDLAGSALREAVGLGAIEPLLANEAVREIVVESPSRIVADLGSGLQPVAGVFSSSDAILTVARRLATQAGDTIDPQKPIHETRLPDGTHLMVLQRPVAVRGAVLCIRRPRRKATSLQDLVQSGGLSAEMHDLLRMAVNARRNILVCGTVGSGVTTVLGALASLVNEHERLVTVENVADLAIGRPVVALTAGGGRNVSMGDLLKQAAWLRPDRLVIDDVQGADAYDVLVTMASRRDGTLAGIHATSTADALRHLQVIANLDGRTNGAALTPLIAEAVHLVVHVQLLADASRRIVGITEVTGANATMVESQDLFAYDGHFASTGAAPHFLGG